MSQIRDYSNVFGEQHDQFVVFYDPEGQSAANYIAQNYDTLEIPIWPWPTQNQAYDPTTSADPDLQQPEASSKFE
ncbi:hypothetical protein ACH5RR_034536 [Cinchona calisaya]|uniref:Uncharacterized protein n=1 Tax=Cinchona calisaya TaxID=153742 RepID=A0ABD2YBU2_9GENT